MKTMYSKNTRNSRHLELLVAFSGLTSAFAFTSVSVPQRIAVSQSVSLNSPLASATSSELRALVYGWDESDESSSSAITYTDFFNDAGGLDSCSPVGSAVAESLSYNKDRVAHLARLAVAFSPPERALKLKDIENVDVVCVREDSIEIEAIICESGGCVSVAVPVKFPQQCAAEGGHSLESCVLRNLEELNVEAETTISVQEQQLENENLDDLCELNSKIEYPSWWVPPECDATLVVECDHIRSLLNEEEFHPEVMALTQDTLRNGQGGEPYVVKKARVAAVGPAGICFKVRAEYQLDMSKPMHTLDVMYPFGGEPIKDGGSLRAAVLGAVASADGDVGVGP